MPKRKSAKNKFKKAEVIGSETTLEQIKRKTPWIFGKLLRKPKIKFPKFRSLRLSLPKPTRSLSVIAIFVILFILQTGVVYLIVRKPYAIGVDPDNDELLFIYPKNIHEAYIIESLVASILMMLFSLGFVFLYHASNFVYDKKMADWFLIIGMLMIIITFTLLQLMLKVKSPKLKI
ncbi:MAG: hypothetical protein ACXABO_01495 [Promethearchaeota archaeon]